MITSQVSETYLDIRVWFHFFIYFDYGDAVIILVLMKWVLDPNWSSFKIEHRRINWSHEIYLRTMMIDIFIDGTILTCKQIFSTDIQ